MPNEPPYTYKATITDITDGDTISAVVDLGFRMTTEQRLRLLGVNTPELHSPDPAERERAQAAKAFTEAELRGKDVLIRTEKADAFGRYLAIVYVDGVEWNTKLLDANLAVPYERRKARATETRA